MIRDVCIVHANCQGDPLVELLSAHTEFSRAYDIHQFVNYTREPVPGELLARCSLFLHQHLGDKWGDLSSRALRARLPRGARTLCLPNLFFKGYWPFWDSNPVINYSDSFLNQLIDRGLDTREIVHLYIHTDLGRFHDLDGMFERSVAHERDKERHWDLKMVDRVLEGFRQKRLFHTINHPCRELCLEVADGVLGALGFGPLDAEAAGDWSAPFGEFELPIHPQVAAHLGLAFAGPETTYNLYGTQGSFVEYVNYYIECRKLGERDFISYLRVRPGLAGA